MTKHAVPAFLRGNYGDAVFQAFKSVEVRVREAGGFPDTDVGTDLVRKAFNETTGVLSDLMSPIAERQAFSHLFAGAIGAYKNPGSHRHTQVDASEAARLLVFASHLLFVVDSRTTS